MRPVRGCLSPGFSFSFCGRGNLGPAFGSPVFCSARFARPKQPRSPPLFQSSLNVQRDGGHHTSSHPGSFLNADGAPKVLSCNWESATATPVHAGGPITSYFVEAFGNDWSSPALDPMAPDYRTVPDYRHLQRVCERQAVVTSNEETRRAFEEMGEEYRKMAEFLEQKLKEQQRN